MRSRRSVLPAAGLALVGLLAASPVAQAAGVLEPADGIYSAEIRRTSYGIPHILAQDFGSLGFGQGYSAGEDIICSLMDTLVTGRGERSKFFGPDERYRDHVTFNATNLAADTLFGDIIARGVVEGLLDSTEPGVAPGEEMRAIVRGYVAGLNQYLEDVGGSAGVGDPTCAGEDWVRPAVEMDLWRGIYAANLLASAGVFAQEIADAAPPTDDGSTGLPTGLLPNPLGDLIPGANPEPAFAPVPSVLPEPDSLRASLGKDPDAPFGSNGTALGGDVTANGRGMVLGNPHFPWQGRYRFTQSHLRIPGVYDVAGAMLHGAPIVNIGFNENVAWTHTVSSAYRFTPYEYRLITPTTYLTDSEPKSVQRHEVTVALPDGSTTIEDLYRTDEGYVLDAPNSLMGWTLDSVWAFRDANAEHLRTLDVFHEMGKATSTAELLANQTATAGMPWVNTLAADRDGNALYADHSVVPHVTAAQIEECMTPIGRLLFELAGLPGLDGTRAGSACAWGSDDDAPRAGTLGAANLPDVTTRDWVINANDSYWLPNPDLPLEGFSPIIGCERCERTLRTRMVYRYVLDRLDGTDGLGGPNTFTHDQLREIETINRVYGAELARENDDLQTACTSSSVDDSFCDTLAAWDGMTNTDSVGAHLFREIWGRGANSFTVPFSASDPVNTPRDLDESDNGVIGAFDVAAAYLDGKGIAYDAPFSTLQMAGDPGAGAIPVQGGFGSTGSANVVAISNPVANPDALYRVTYGSSHIQAVAFTDTGVDARTILTYSQSSNPSSPHQDDQTELWSREEWVDFAFTEEEIAADLISTKTVTNAVAAPVAAPSDTDPLPATGGGQALLGLGLVALARRAAARKNGAATT